VNIWRVLDSKVTAGQTKERVMKASFIKLAGVLGLLGALVGPTVASAHPYWGRPAPVFEGPRVAVRGPGYYPRGEFEYRAPVRVVEHGRYRPYGFHHRYHR
jgi:hypothetical protein